VDKQQYEAELARAGDVQRAAGWSEASIASYAAEHRAMFGDSPDCLLAVGAGLAQDNSRHGVGERDWLDDRDDADLESYLEDR
jgi:hypothetical protein